MFSTFYIFHKQKNMNEIEKNERKTKNYLNQTELCATCTIAYGYGSRCYNLYDFIKSANLCLFFAIWCATTSDIFHFILALCNCLLSTLWRDSHNHMECHTEYITFNHTHFINDQTVNECMRLKMLFFSLINKN